MFSHEGLTQEEYDVIFKKVFQDYFKPPRFKSGDAVCLKSEYDQYPGGKEVGEVKEMTGYDPNEPDARYIVRFPEAGSISYSDKMLEREH